MSEGSGGEGGGGEGQEQQQVQQAARQRSVEQRQVQQQTQDRRPGVDRVQDIPDKSARSERSDRRDVTNKTDWSTEEESAETGVVGKEQGELRDVRGDKRESANLREDAPPADGGLVDARTERPTPSASDQSALAPTIAARATLEAFNFAVSQMTGEKQMKDAATDALKGVAQSLVRTGSQPPETPPSEEYPINSTDYSELSNWTLLREIDAVRERLAAQESYPGREQDEGELPTLEFEVARRDLPATALDNSLLQQAYGREREWLASAGPENDTPERSARRQELLTEMASRMETEALRQAYPDMTEKLKQPESNLDQAANAEWQATLRTEIVARMDDETLGREFAQVIDRLNEPIDYAGREEDLDRFPTLETEWVYRLAKQDFERKVQGQKKLEQMANRPTEADVMANWVSDELGGGFFGGVASGLTRFVAEPVGMVRDMGRMIVEGEDFEASNYQASSGLTKSFLVRERAGEEITSASGATEFAIGVITAPIVAVTEFGDAIASGDLEEIGEKSVNVGLVLATMRGSPGKPVEPAPPLVKAAPSPLEAVPPPIEAVPPGGAALSPPEAVPPPVEAVSPKGAAPPAEGAVSSRTAPVAPDVPLYRLIRFPVKAGKTGRGITPKIRARLEAIYRKYGGQDPMDVGHSFGQEQVFTSPGETALVGAEPRYINRSQGAAIRRAAKARREWNAANPDKPLPVRKPKK